MVVSAVDAVAVVASMGAADVVEHMWRTGMCEWVMETLLRFYDEHTAENGCWKLLTMKQMLVLARAGTAGMLWMVNEREAVPPSFPAGLVRCLSYPDLHVLRYTCLALWAVCRDGDAMEVACDAHALAWLTSITGILLSALDISEAGVPRDTAAAGSAAAASPRPQRNQTKPMQRTSSANSARMQIEAQVSVESVHSRSSAKSTRATRIKRRRQATVTVHNILPESGHWKPMLQHAREAPMLTLATLRASLGCLWLMLYRDASAVEFMRTESVVLLVDLVRSRDHPRDITKAQTLAVKMLWCLAASSSTRLLLVRYRVPQACFDLASDLGVPKGLRALAAGLLLDLSKDDEFRESLVGSRGADFQEEMLVGFLASDDRQHQEYGAACIARMCKTQVSKQAVAKLGGARRLVEMLRTWRFEQDAMMTRVAILHALLNLTTCRPCMQIVGRHGTDVISEMADDDSVSR